MKFYILFQFKQQLFIDYCSITKTTKTTKTKNQVKMSVELVYDAIDMLSDKVRKEYEQGLVMTTPKKMYEMMEILKQSKEKLEITMETMFKHSKTVERLYE